MQVKRRVVLDYLTSMVILNISVICHVHSKQYDILVTVLALHKDYDIVSPLRYFKI